MKKSKENHPIFNTLKLDKLLFRKPVTVLLDLLEKYGYDKLIEYANNYSYPDLARAGLEYSSTLKNSGSSKINKKGFKKALDTTKKKLDKIDPFKTLETEELTFCLQLIDNMYEDGSAKIRERKNYIPVLLKNLEIKNDIRKNGLVHLDSREMDCSSETSKKYLKDVKLEDLKLPFLAATISFKETTINYSVVEVQDQKVLEMIIIIDNQIRYCKINFKNTLGESAQSISNVNILNPEYVAEDFTTDNENTFYEFISLMLYITTYIESEERITQKALYLKKDHKTSDVKIGKTIIINGVAKIKSSDNEGHGKKIGTDKTWIVIGHWRNQKYKDGNRLKWIDPYWKGSGKEVMEKTYMVEK